MSNSHMQKMNSYKCIVVERRKLQVGLHRASTHVPAFVGLFAFTEVATLAARLFFAVQGIHLQRKYADA